ncbi:MAG: class I SAM-dependent methyltransferase [Terriglobia bacterium]
MSTDWNAQLYDTKHAFVWQFGADLLELLKPERGERILDIGCGTGHLTAKIAAAGAQVIGLDSSRSMIEEARKNYPDLRFTVADSRDFHFDEPFDAVFSNAALHWVTEARSVVECVRAALKPGGRFVAEFGGKGNVEKLVSGFYAALDSIGCHPKRDPNPWYFPGISEYSALLEQNGLEVTFAALFDRPTPLDDGEAGMRNWIKMFAGSFYSHVPPQKQDAFVENVERILRPVLFQEGSWRLDCRRLRIVARKL